MLRTPRVARGVLYFCLLFQGSEALIADEGRAPGKSATEGLEQ
jgi:hypothetical protein